MDTDEVILRSWEEAYRGMGRPVPSREVLHGTFGEPLVYSMKNMFPDVDYKIPLGLYRTYNTDNFLQYAKPYPGMVELIDRLREKGILTALVTARLRRTTFMGLEHFDLVRRFDAILTEDDITESKPDPAPVYVTLRRLGIDFKESPRGAVTLDGEPLKSRIVMIGDTIHDMQCCENAGIGSVLVGWTNALAITDNGEGTKPRYTAAAHSGETVTPDYVIHTAEEFDAALK